MSHPFGELLKQYRRRRPGLSQERLAHMIGYDQAVLARMAQGKKDLTGPSGRNRVVRLIEMLRSENAIHAIDEANALLAAAGLPPLYDGNPVELALLRTFRTTNTTALVLSNPTPGLHYTLPAPVSSFVGRDQDVALIASMLQSARLVTLTGLGGSGKTRLALESGIKQSQAFIHGACWIGLAPVRHAGDVLPEIAKVLDVRESPGTPLLDSVKRFLANKSVLLLLDNFEHVLNSATLISELLMAAPGVKVLTTSREPLRLSGEHIYVVEPLELPSAVELFVQRAKSVKLGFQISDGNVPIIMDICHRMDRLPLAIELAAARVRQFSPAALLANLSERRSLSVLTTAPRDAPSRHRTLRDAIAWSYDLLSEEERRTLRVLGVFIGGAEVEQIARIGQFVLNAWTPESITTSELIATFSSNLQSCVDKNLIRAVEQADTTIRYFLPELIREFVLEQLHVRGELNATQQAHAEAFLVLARQGMWDIRFHAQVYWHDRLERDYPNFREALTWSFGEPGSGLIGCQLTEALSYFWFIATRYLAETRAWTLKARAAKKPDMPPLVLGGVCASVIINSHLWSFSDWVEAGREALVHYCTMNDVRGIALAKYGIGAGLIGLRPQDEEGLRFLNECVLLCDESGNDWTKGHALHRLGAHALNMNDLAQAETLHREMVEIRRKMGNVVEISIGLYQLANVVSRRYRFIEANEYLREASALAYQVDSPQDVMYAESQLGDNLCALGDLSNAGRVLESCVVLARNRLLPADLVYPLILLSKVENAQRNHADAHTLLSEAIQIIRALNWPATAYAFQFNMYSNMYMDLLDAMAIVVVARGDARASAKLWGAADILWEAAHSPRPDHEVCEFAAYRTLASESLGEATYVTAYAEGRAMTLEQAIEYALANA